MKKLYEENKYLIISFFSSLILGLLLGLLRVKNIPFLLLSISLNIFLITIIKIIIKLLKIEFSSKEKKYIAISIIVMYLFYLISIMTRKFIYYWDFSCYYNIQAEIESAFNTNIFKGLRHLVGSTWAGEYGSFLCFFPEVIFNFTNKTMDSYLLSNALLFTPYLIITFSIVLKKLISVFKIKKDNIFYITGLIVFLLFPIVHSTFIYGQPDVFGLSFIFLVIALTIDYDFYKIDYERLVFIGILSFFLIIARRWYMYFVLVYFLCYGLYLLINNIKNKKRNITILKHLIYYALVVGVSFGIILFPLFKKILLNGYSYEYYMNGGFPGELESQLHHLGYFGLLIIIIGVIYGVINKKYRNYSILLTIEYFLIIFLFTRMQNMGLHHSLLLVPIYIYFILMFILLIIDKNYLVIITILLLIVNFGFGVFNTNSKIFTDVSLKVPNQEDYEEIKEVGNWLKDNLKDDDAYMITHNNMYNPDKFRNLYLPDTSIKDHLAYGSAIIGTHEFPIELFTSKYIITTNPFESVSIEGRYNKVFNDLLNKNVFKNVKEFDMHNGYKILIYERIENVSQEEINMYKEELKDLSKDYPHLYIDIIENYEKEYA